MKIKSTAEQFWDYKSQKKKWIQFQEELQLKQWDAQMNNYTFSNLYSAESSLMSFFQSFFQFLYVISYT